MKIDFHSKFTKKLKKFPKKIQEQFYERLEIFETNQFTDSLNNHAVHYPYEGCRSINITGDVRALYEVIGDTALFVRIGSHSELYK
jgi:addiction module RelE/StbE family toxin